MARCLLTVIAVAMRYGDNGNTYLSNIAEMSPTDECLRFLVHGLPGKHGHIAISGKAPLISAFYIPVDAVQVDLIIGGETFSWFSDYDSRTLEELLRSEKSELSNIKQETMIDMLKPSAALKFIGNPKQITVGDVDYFRLEMVYPFLYLQSIAFHHTTLRIKPEMGVLLECVHLQDPATLLVPEPEVYRLFMIVDHKNKGLQPTLNLYGMLGRRYTLPGPPELELLNSLEQRTKGHESG